MGKKLAGCPSSSSSLSITHHVAVPHYPLKAEKQTIWKCNACSKYLCHTGNEETDCFLQLHMKVHILFILLY